MIHNTYYNLIDTLIFAMGKEKFATLFNGWDKDMTYGEYAEKFSIHSTVASVLVDCFRWADDNDWKPWTR